MTQQDTIRLLNECDAGVKMGVQSIEDVLDHVHTPQFRQTLWDSKQEHLKMQGEIKALLSDYCPDCHYTHSRQKPGKAPTPMAEMMAKLKTGAMLAVADTEKTVADLMTDGCNMGVKSLNKYLNQYEAADERSKDITKKIISMEKQLAHDIEGYL